MDEKVMEMLAKILEGQKDIQNELKQEIREVSSKIDKLEMRMENVLQLETAHIRRIK